MNIVFATDFRSQEPLVTAIKSICCHNRNINFYLINSDFAEEWFSTLNQKLQPFNSQIYDVKVNNHQMFDGLVSPQFNHSPSSYYRFLIADVVPDRALYLNVDVIVHGSLEQMYNETDLSRHFLGAVSDPLISQLGNQQGTKTEYPIDLSSGYFNSGVMLINTNLWREHKVLPTILGLPADKIHQFPYGEQDILNVLFKSRWFKLHRFYNYQVGSEWVFERENRADCIEQLNGQLPLITHFTTDQKPYVNGHQARLREWYWHYHYLDWNDIGRAYPNG